MAHTTPLFIITGTPGSGKTTIANALMQAFPFGMHIPVDDIRRWVASGRSEPVPAYTDETARQFTLARNVTTSTAYMYLKEGFAVAIDDVITRPTLESFPFDALEREQMFRILLKPSLTETLERNKTRVTKSFEAGILNEVIEKLYYEMNPEVYEKAGWLVIDSTEKTVRDVVEKILVWSNVLSQ